MKFLNLFYFLLEIYGFFLNFVSLRFYIKIRLNDLKKKYLLNIRRKSANYNLKSLISILPVQRTFKNENF